MQAGQAAVLPCLPLTPLDADAEWPRPVAGTGRSESPARRNEATGSGRRLCPAGSWPKLAAETPDPTGPAEEAATGPIRAARE